MKKILALAGAGAILLGMAVPAFAVTTNIVNKAKVSNSTTAVASTGVSAGNVVSVEKAGVGNINVGGSNEIKKLSTGNADALAVGAVVANTQIGCATCGGGSIKNKAKVKNTTTAQADTGVQAGSGVSVYKAHVGGINLNGNNEIKKLHTGDADSDSIGIVVVNTQWTP